MAKNFRAHVLCTVDQTPPEYVAHRLDRIKILSTLGHKPFLLDDQVFDISWLTVSENVSRLFKLLQDDGKFTAGDVIDLPLVMNQRARAEDNSHRVEAYSLYCDELFHPSGNWPCADATSGTILVLGDTASGKTHYFRHSVGADVIIRYGEPQEDVDLEEHTVKARSLPHMISMALSLSVLGLHTCADSLRSLVYGIKGNAGESGFSTGFHDFNTQLNNVFADAGTVCFFSVNPLLGGGAEAEQKADRLFTRLASGCSGAVHLVNRGEVRATSYRLVTGRVSYSASNAVDSIPVQKGGVSDPSSSVPNRDAFTILNLDRLKDSGAVDNRAAAAGDSPILDTDSNKPNSPRATATFTL